MIQFLVRKFIPDADNIQDARVRGRYGTLSEPWVFSSIFCCS